MKNSVILMIGEDHTGLYDLLSEVAAVGAFENDLNRCQIYIEASFDWIFITEPCLEKKPDLWELAHTLSILDGKIVIVMESGTDLEQWMKTVNPSLLGHDCDDQYCFEQHQLLVYVNKKGCQNIFAPKEGQGHTPRPETSPILLGLHKNTPIYYNFNKHKITQKSPDGSMQDINFGITPISKEYTPTPTVLNLKITSNCNLSCKYCYEDHNLPKGYSGVMDQDTAIRAIEWYAQYKKTKSVNICFIGGEPLLNFDIIKGTVTHFKKDPSFDIHYSLTTNATLLTPRLIQFISENDIGVNISIDGDKELHDKMRLYRNGNPSFHVVANAISLFAENKKYLITALVTGTKYAHNYLSHIRCIVNMGIRTIYFSYVGGKSQYSETAADYTQSCRELDNLIAYSLDQWLNGGVNVYPFCNIFKSIVTLAPIAPLWCSAGQNSMCIHKDGQVTPCYKFSTYQFGNINSACDVNKEIVQQFRSQIDSVHRVFCKHCWISQFCNGFCIKDYTTMLKISNTRCRLMRYFVKKSLLLLAEATLDNPKKVRLIVRSIQMLEKKALKLRTNERGKKK